MKKSYYPNSKGSALPILAIVVVILILIIVFSGTVFKNKLGGKSSAVPQDTNQTKLSSPHMVVYGEWTENSTVIKGYDLETDSQYKVAELPLNIKKVSLLSPDKLLLINNTNEQDHGSKISVYSLKDKKMTTLAKADPGFGIDDYMLSPNHKYLAAWEVQFGTNPPVLQGGKSRVTSINLDDPEIKNLIENQDATADNPVFYPRAVTDSGQIFMDRFLPNSGAGWAYGMRVSNLTGSQKQDLDNMRNGTYGTQPALSPDGKQLVFAGYDGSRGSGVEEINGFRRALVIPNTVETLDTLSLKRTKLDALGNDQTYVSVGWDTQQKNVIVYSAISKENPGEEQTYFYNLEENKILKADLDKTSTQKLVQAFKKKVLGASKDDKEKVVAGLGKSTILTGSPNNASPVVGNLGQTYASPYESFALYDPVTGARRTLGEGDSLKQLIAVAPTSQVNTKNLTLLSTSSDKDSMQLKTFTPSVAPKPLLTQSREDQQSSLISTNSSLIPSCNELRHEQCVGRLPAGAVEVLTYQEFINETNSGNPPATDRIPVSRDGVIIGNYTYFRLGRDSGRKNEDPATWNYNRVDSANIENYNVCLRSVRGKGTLKSECLGSPLYIYGEAGRSLEVKPLTSISNPSVPYVRDSGFQITTLGEGKFEVNGVIASSINYDYEIAKRKVIAPKYGLVVPVAQINEAITTIAAGLDLNQKETADLIGFASGRFNAPFIFVSFFDQKTSEEILPLKITPKPDNYLNTVFYFKSLNQKPGVMPEAPKYPEKLSRDGLSVVEISEFVDN